MDISLYNAILKCDVDVYQQFQGKITEQRTAATQNTALHVIAEHHDCPGCVRVILSYQSSEKVKSLLTWTNLMGDTAVCIAARNDHLEMLKLLIEGAQLLDQEQGSCVTQDMLRMTNENGDTALHEAVKHKCPEIVKLLVQADPHFQHLPNNMMTTPLYLAMDNIGEDQKTGDNILESIISICTCPGYGGPAGETVLHAAARSYFSSKWIEQIHKKNSAIVKQVDERGFTPLHHAALNGFGADSAEEFLKIERSMAYVRAVDTHDKMTALHIAALHNNQSVMEKILEHCPDCWGMTTSNRRNILHLAAEKQSPLSIKFILKHPWAMNLINQVDERGNTPLHLGLSTMENFFGLIIKDLIHFPKVQFYLRNLEGNTQNDLFVRLRKKSDLPSEHKRKRVEEMRRNAERHLVVAALIATVTFAAGFTLPGGYDGNSGPNQGMAVSIKKVAFKTFVITNTLAIISSFAAIFLHFTATFYKHDQEKLYNRYESALVLLLFAMVTMVIAFITGMFSVLDKSLGLAVTVCIIGSLGIMFLLYLVYKTYQDLQSHNMNPFHFRPLGIEV